MKHFKTPKGTELPLMDIKGKDYLRVQQRIIWFLEENEGFEIHTEFKLLTGTEAVAWARITTGKRTSTASKHETKLDFSDFAEKAETGAIGRALANLGYGTQFAAADFEEGHRVVDAPRTQPGPTSSKPGASITGVQGKTITIFKKYSGKTYGQVSMDELANSVQWLKDTAAKEGKPMGRGAQQFIEDVRDLQLEHEFGGEVVTDFAKNDEIPF